MLWNIKVFLMLQDLYVKLLELKHSNSIGFDIQKLEQDNEKKRIVLERYTALKLKYKDILSKASTQIVTIEPDYDIDSDFLAPFNVVKMEE
jgi:hypothetical protein